MYDAQRFSMMFRTLLAGAAAAEEEWAVREWHDAISMAAISFQRFGPLGALFLLGSTLDGFIRSAERGTIPDVPERVVDLNRRILREVRDRLTPDEREELDAVTREHFDEIDQWLEEKRGEWGG